MRRLGGIIHPSSFQMNELIVSMAADHYPPPSDFFRHKNLELALFGQNIDYKDPSLPVVLFDGKIHNANEIRDQLQLSSFSDEVLIATCYLHFGERFITHLKGEFVIALFDRKKEELLLYRDRLGKKMLYWTVQGGYFLFSTELKSLLATGVVPQTPSMTGLSSYLYFGFIPQELTPVAGVNKLLPGHFLKINLHGKFLLDQYWSLSALLEKKEKKEEAEFENTVDLAIKQNMPLEGHVGLLHAGSHGYTMIEEHMTENSGLQMFHPPQKEPEEAVEDLVSMVWHLDEPISDLSALNIWSAGKMAHTHVTTMFVDMGWEELIAAPSKTRAASQSLAYKLARLPSPIRNSVILPLVSCLAPSFKWRILRNIEINRALMDYLSEIALFKGRERKGVSDALYSHFDPEVFVEKFHRLSRIDPGHDLILYFNAKTKIPDSLFLQYEKLLGYFSIDVMAPFLEEGVIEFAAHAPLHLKSASNFEKVYLNDWCKSLYFRELFTLLADGDLVRQGWISSKWIRNQLGYPHLIPKTFRKLWAILVLEIWFRLYITSPIGKGNMTLSVDEFLRT